MYYVVLIAGGTYPSQVAQLAQDRRAVYEGHSANGQKNGSPYPLNPLNIGVVHLNAVQSTSLEDKLTHTKH